MAKKVFICNSYFYQYDKKQWKTAQPYPPLGTLYACAVMLEEGYDVKFYDNNLVKHHSEIYQEIENYNPDILVIYDDGFNYLTKMCLSNMQNAAFDILAFAKAREITTICNGSDSTDHYKQYHNQNADYIIHGEGEDTLVDLCQRVFHGQAPEDLLGISYKKENEVVLNPKRPVKRDLDSLPMPKWDLVDIESYRTIWIENQGFFSLNMATTRGCPYKCNWCAKPIYGNRYNTRSPLNVVNELEYLIETFNVRYFWMCDDIFGLKPNWVKEFKELVIERGLDFKYKIQSRVDLMLKEDQISDLVDSGVDTIWIGAESGSQKILDAMDKGTQVEQIYDATQKLKAQNVKVAFFLQFGYLDETWSDIKKTINMVLDLMPDDIGISVSYPLPGTKFYEKVKLSMKAKTNWTDSDDLDMMFENTYSPIFYKTLHRYVHNRYRIKRAILSLKSIFNLSAISRNIKHIIRGVYHLPLAFINGLLLKLRSQS